jgi:hypothetical protein
MSSCAYWHAFLKGHRVEERCVSQGEDTPEALDIVQCEEGRAYVPVSVTGGSGLSEGPAYARTTVRSLRRVVGKRSHGKRSRRTHQSGVYESRPTTPRARLASETPGRRALGGMVLLGCAGRLTSVGGREEREEAGARSPTECIDISGSSSLRGRCADMQGLLRTLQLARTCILM